MDAILADHEVESCESGYCYKREDSDRGKRENPPCGFAQVPHKCQTSRKCRCIEQNRQPQISIPEVLIIPPFERGLSVEEAKI
jgi:hypothetical protein